MENKKGAVVSGLTAIFLYFGFILLIIIFFFIFKATKGATEVKISGYIQNTDVNYVILNYLRTPVKFDIDNNKIDTDMADLIIRYFFAENTDDIKKYQNLVKKETEKIFNRKYPHLEWKIKISDRSNLDMGAGFAKGLAGGLTTSKLTKESTLVKDMAVVCVVLPNPELKDLIKVEFDFLNSNTDTFARDKFHRLKEDEFNC